MSKKQWAKGFFDGLKEGLKKGRIQGATAGVGLTAVIALIIDAIRKE